MSATGLPLGDGSGTWGQATAQFVDDVADGDVFSDHWAREQQAHLLDVDEKVKDWAETSVLLTATASKTLPHSDDPAPPIFHLRSGILASKQARQKALSRSLRNRTWRALRTYGSGVDGYQHQHTAVFVGSQVSAGVFDPWVSAHTNTPLADESAHESGTVEIRDVEPDDRGLVGYIMQNTPGLDTRGERGHGLAQAPTEQQRGAVVLDRADVTPLTFGHRTRS